MLPQSFHATGFSCLYQLSSTMSLIAFSSMSWLISLHLLVLTGPCYHNYFFLTTPEKTWSVRGRILPSPHFASVGVGLSWRAVCQAVQIYSEFEYLWIIVPCTVTKQKDYGKINLNSPLQLFLGEVQWLQKMTSRRHTHSATLPGEQTSSYKPEESAYLASTIGVTAADANTDSRDKVGYCC